MLKPRTKKKDENETAAALVRKVTGTKRARVSDLLASPELRRKYREAKRSEAAKRKTVA